MSHLVTEAVDLQGQAAELEAGLAQTQCSIVAAREWHQQLQSQRSQLTQRCSNSSGVLDSMKSLASLIPSVPATAPAPARFTTASVREPPTLASAPPVSTALLNTGHRTHKGLFERSSAAVPPPLSAYHHHRAVSVEQLTAFRDSTAQLRSVAVGCLTSPGSALHASTWWATA